MSVSDRAKHSLQYVEFGHVMLGYRTHGRKEFSITMQLILLTKKTYHC